MTRARARSDSNSVQLFPFLAVLLCMMGALILLLVVIARHARAQASIQGELAAPAAAADETARREELDWRREQLAAQRDRTQAELSERRLELGHFEEHARSLRAELDELERAQGQLEQLESTDESQKRELAARVSTINLQITETQAKLLRARQQLASQPTSYSIIPYLGPNSTDRPPLYIECRNDRVVLQPEGVVLTAEDFEGPLGPSNPLASALRAAREHMARNRRTNAGEMGEPYPLLLVRPDGIMAYWMARAALESWGSDFGYELVDADWKLDFKTPDNELARTEETAVAEARVQQRELAMMMPRLQGQSVGRQYRASSHGGGIVADEELPEEDRPGHRKYGAARNGRGGYFDPYPQANPATETAAASGAGNSALGQGGSGGLGFQGNGTGSGAGFGSGYPAGAFQGGPAGGHSLMGGNDGGLYPGEATLGSSTPGGAMGPGGPMGSGSGSGSGGFATGGGPGGSASTGGNFAGSGSGNSNGSSTGDQSAGLNGSGLNGSGPNGGGQNTGGPNGTGQLAAGAAGSAAGGAAGGANGGAAGGANGSANCTGPGDAGSDSNTGGAADGPKLAAPGAAQGAAGGNTAADGGITSGGDPNGTLATNASNPDSGGPSRGGQPGAPDSRNPFSSPLDSYGTTSARSGAPGSSSVTSPSSSGSPGGGSGAGGSSPGPPSVSKSTPPPGSMAEHRGKNWAVPNEMRRVAPVTRPVMIRCSKSSLVILADDGSGKQVRAVPLAEHTEDSVDDLLTGVWDHITSWGLAGHGMYWHPVLVLDTTADGQARAADLKRLMASSGIDVRDKQVNPPVARAKKKRWWQW